MAQSKSTTVFQVVGEPETKALTQGAKIFQRFRHPYILFSGGRDSLVALHLTKNACKSLGVEARAIHIDTTVETPGNLDYVREICHSMDMDLSLIRPRMSYFEMVRRWGFPTMSRRWCKWRIKIRPTRRFIRSLSLEDVILIDGLRSSESWIRQRMANHRRIADGLTYHEALKCIVFHPVYKWSLNEVLDYIRRHGLSENPLYRSFGKAFDCWCTVYKSPSNLVELKFKCPRLFHKLMRLERELRSGGSAMFDRSRSERIYLRDIDKRPQDYVARPCSKSCTCLSV